MREKVSGNILKHIFIGMVPVLLFLVSCNKERYITSPDVSLHFSVDTLYFDTIFTTIGSTTRSFTVHNTYDRTLRIREVRLAGGESSPFRLNVDGVHGTLVQDVEILPHDSIYVFVEVTIDPLGNNLPLLVHDSVVFVTNGSLQDLDLVAWGQDVHLIDGEILGTQNWPADKPYLVVHSMMVDTNAVLTIEKGVLVYSHFGSTIYVAGRLIVEGTREEPVIFSGDRLEQMYEDIPGQWSGIYFLNGSSGNRLENVEIKNGIYGLHLGNFYADDPPPDLFLHNVVVMHMNWAGISSVGAKIMAENCLVADCGFFGLSLTTGGDYRFIHCSVVNYWNWSNRSTPSVLVSDYYNLNDTVIFRGELVRADFLNTIIYGDKEEEFVVAPWEVGGKLNYLLDHVLLREKNTEELDTVRYRKVWLNQDPGFVSVWEYDFHLDSLAFARNRGAATYGQLVPFDLEGHDRMADQEPDLGAYEWVDTAAVR
jgi:hypothetical protein